MNTFQVWKRTNPDIKYRIQAETANKAKRIFLKQRGICPSDYWCGLTNVSAKKLPE